MAWLSKCFQFKTLLILTSSAGANDMANNPKSPIKIYTASTTQNTRQNLYRFFVSKLY
jgi:hypothetical protein